MADQDQPRIRMITRRPGDFLRETKHDIHRVQRNYDPKLHPFALQREYQRALNATKLERVFAKPFIGNMSGHGDIVSNLMKHQTKLSIMASGAYDGVIKIWNLANRKCLRTIQAHNSQVKAMCISRLNSNHFFSVDSSSNIKKWRYFSGEHMNIIRTDDAKLSRKKSKKGEKLDDDEAGSSDESDKDAEQDTDESTDIDDEYRAAYDIEDDVNYTDEMQDEDIPIDTILAKHIILGMDHHYYEPYLITSGDKVELWEENRKEPIRQWSWGADSTHYCKYNPVEANFFAALSNDRAITLFDMRKPEPLRKVILAMRSNQLCWNPMEAFKFTVANEDHDLHTFDMRKLERPLALHKDHTAAVISLDYSPTGAEIVSGSYDKTIRIFPSRSGHSRDVYYTKRMQKITDVIWTLDAKYIVSASDEMDIRMWRANASEKIGPKYHRQRVALETNEALKQKFKHHPEVKRILRHRHLPKHVYNERKLKRIMLDARKRKEERRKANSKPGSVVIVPEKEKHIVRVEE
jgi:WD repeat and SOF domain-containing protein 1